MAKYKIIHERDKCIGCGACASACPDFWKMKADNKSFLKGSKKINSCYELEVDEPGCNRKAEASCPVDIIHIKEMPKTK